MPDFDRHGRGHRCASLCSRSNRCRLLRIDGSRCVAVNDGPAALDDTNLAFCLGNFQFGHIGVRYQINQGLEFA